MNPKDTLPSSMMASQTKPSSPVKENLPVMEGLDLLADALSRLVHNTDILESRLCLVLHPSNPDEKLSGHPEPMRSPLAETIYRQLDMVNGINNRLLTISGRLEL